MGLKYAVLVLGGCGGMGASFARAFKTDVSSESLNDNLPESSGLKASITCFSLGAFNLSACETVDKKYETITGWTAGSRRDMRGWVGGIPKGWRIGGAARSRREKGEVVKKAEIGASSRPSARYDLSRSTHT
jgi:hypothetical protein